MKPATLHKRACAIVGVDPAKIKLVGPAEYKALAGHGVGRNLGLAHHTSHIIYVRRGQGLVTYVHELLHHLFPSRPHWWIFLAAEKLTSQPSPIARYGYGHGLCLAEYRVREPKHKLLALARAAAEHRELA